MSNPQLSGPVAREVVGSLHDGQLVVDRLTTHIHPELRRQPALLSEALSRVVVNQTELVPRRPLTFELVFDQPVGWTSCVGCQPHDNYVWAVPLGRYYYRRFVLGRNPEPTDVIVVCIVWHDKLNSFELRTAYLGRSPELYQAERTLPLAERRHRFWNDHVLVYPGNDFVRPNTRRDDRPINWHYEPFSTS